MWYFGLRDEDGTLFLCRSARWPCCPAAEIIFDVRLLLSDGGHSKCVRNAEQPEWTESCLRARLLNVGSFRFKMRRPDYLPYHLRVLVLKAAPAPLRISPENPQYPWNAALLSRASPSRVRLAPKTAQRVFWNLAAPVWERKSFQILFIFVDALKVHQVDLINFKILFSMEVKLLQVNTEWIVRFYFILFLSVSSVAVATSTLSFVP